MYMYMYIYIYMSIDVHALCFEDTAIDNHTLISHLLAGGGLGTTLADGGLDTPPPVASQK